MAFLSPTHEISYVAGYLLTTDKEYSVQEYSVDHDRIWAE